MLRLASENTSGCAKFDPGRSEDEQQIGELAESEHRTAEYQAERSADVTHQSQRRVGSFSLDVRILQLRVVDLVTMTNNAFIYIRRHSGIVTPLAVVAAMCSLYVSPFGPLRPNATSSTKLEIHNISQRRHRRTEPRPQKVCIQNFVKIGPAIPEICSRTDRQTDRWVNHNTFILRTNTGAQ